MLVSQITETTTIIKNDYIAMSRYKGQNLPETGGKKTARIPRKTSEPHMFAMKGEPQVFKLPDHARDYNWESISSVDLKIE